MTWNELHTLTLERVKEQPRGFQARLAERLGVTTASVAQWVGGGRPIPTDRIHEVLEMVGLELTVQPRGGPTPIAASDETTPLPSNPVPQGATP